MPQGNFSANVDRFTGFADLYDRYRPSPPDALAGLMTQFTGLARPSLVIDLGSGTGLSTRYWADKADRAIGVEPAPDMRRQAEANTAAPNLSYCEGFSHATGLPAQCAQVVVCMQSLHWMDPDGTFAEATRLLLPGGAFVVCDYDWPPMCGSWEADAAFAACITTARRLEQERNVAANLRQWSKAEHFTRMQASGCFRHLKDTAIHHQDTGNADRLVSLFLSQGYVMALRKSGISDDELGLNALRAIAQRTLGDRASPFLWCARVRLALA